jgi:5'-nucleotidase
MTRILVTNDDGVEAPGLHALATAASEAGFAVVVAAPREEQSGMSASLTAVTSEGRVVVERRTAGRFPVYAVAASPAYIVVLNDLEVFGPRAEVVLSGINRGANAGNAVLHSGTVGAALTAATQGLRAMAVSLDVLVPRSDGASGSTSDGGSGGAAGGGPEGSAGGAADGAFEGALDSASGGAKIEIRDDALLHWDTAAAQAVDLLEWLVSAPESTVLNLNVPDLPSVRGLREATLATFGQAQMAVAEQGEGFIRMTAERVGEPLVPGTDLAFLADGYATVTALRPPGEAPAPRIPAQRNPPP